MERKVLVGAKDCSACQILKDHGYDIVDMESEKGQEIVKALNVQTIPSCIVLEGEGDQETVRYCTEDEFLDVIENGQRKEKPVA